MARFDHFLFWNNTFSRRQMRLRFSSSSSPFDRWACRGSMVPGHVRSTIQSWIENDKSRKYNQNVSTCVVLCCLLITFPLLKRRWYCFYLHLDRIPYLLVNNFIAQERIESASSAVSLQLRSAEHPEFPGEFWYRGAGLRAAALGFLCGPSGGEAAGLLHNFSDHTTYSRAPSRGSKVPS